MGLQISFSGTSFVGTAPPGQYVVNKDDNFRPVEQRKNTKPDYGYLMSPRDLTSADLRNPNIKHYYFTRAQIAKALPKVAEAFDRTFAIRDNNEGELIGSGFLCGENSMLTCSHVVKEYLVVNQDEQSFGAVESACFDNGDAVTLRNLSSVYYTDNPEDNIDLALFESPAIGVRGFIPLSDKLPEIDERVYLIGNPTVIDRQVISVGTVQDIRYHDDESAAIAVDNEAFSGSSGGVLVNEQGEAIGIQQAVISGKRGYVKESICIPSPLAVKLIADPQKFIDKLI